MIDAVNTNLDRHIITIEDPIEYYHEHKKSIVNQREVGVDVPTFAEGLRRALRQDPDVILLGRDARHGDDRHGDHRRRDGPPGVRHAAHDGLGPHDGPHHRPVPVRPAGAGPRPALGLDSRRHLAGAHAEADKKGVIAAFEVMVDEPRHREPHPQGGDVQDPSTIQTGARASACILLDDHLLELCREGKITKETATERAQSPRTPRLEKLEKSEVMAVDRFGTRKKLLGQILKEMKSLHEGQIQEALQIQKKPRAARSARSSCARAISPRRS